MFITPAYAQAASDTQTQLLQFAPIVLIFIVFYFFMIRPQSQKAKQLKAAQAGLRRGDRIITAGGIIGTVARVVTDDEIEIKIAENVNIRVVRSTISTILAKPEPTTAADKGAKPRPVRGPNGKKDDTVTPLADVAKSEETVSTPTGGQGGGSAI